MNLATHITRFAALCATALLCSSLAHAQQTAAPPQRTPPAQQRTRQQPPQGSAPKPFTLPRTETFKLPNGIEATLVPYGEIPKVTVSVVTRTGNIDDPANKTGLADMLGDLMKEGTQTRTAAQIAEATARMGGSLNVSVGADQTSFSADVLAESGAELVRLLADIVQRPLLPASELPRLQADALRQLAIARTQPGSLALERFRQILYPDHPYGRIFPTEAGIKSYAIEDLRKFHTDNFGANRTHVYVAGRFDAKQMRDAITAAFNSMPKGAPARLNPPRPAAFTARRVALINRPNAPQSTLYIGLPTIDPTHKDYIPFVVANALLGGSFASRITSNIREQKGYTYSPYSQLSTRYRDGYWVEVADVTTDVTGASLKEIFYEVDRLAKEPPTPEELTGIKNYLAGIFVLQNSSRPGVIGQLSFVRLHGLDESYLNTYVQRVLAVTPADVQRITSAYLRPDRMAIVVVGDEAKIKDQVAAYGELMR